MPSAPPAPFWGILRGVAWLCIIRGMTRLVEAAGYEDAPSFAELTTQDIQEAQEYLSPGDYSRLVELINGVSLPPLSFKDFIQQAWHVVEPGVPFVDNWHIDAICDHLEAVVWGQIRNLIINIPPRHMKSTLVGVMFQPWVWTFRPWSRWLFFSHNRGLSTRDSVQARSIIDSPFYRANFGHVVQFTKDQNQKTRFKNTKGGMRVALGVGGAIGEGGDFLVADDLLAPDDRYSDAKRERANDFWGTTVATRRNSEHAASIIICQRLAVHDIVGYVEEKEKAGGERYERLIIPAEFERANRAITCIGWQDPRKREGELLWPKRFDRHFIDALKHELGSQQAAAQLQQRPTALGGNIFKKGWFGFWVPRGQSLPPVKLRAQDGSTIDAPLTELPASMGVTLASWDMAFKDSAQSSFVSGQVWAQGAGHLAGNRYLLDQTRARLDFPATVKAVQAQAAAWPNARPILVEDRANGSAVIQTLKGQIPGMIPVQPMGGKIARAQAVAPVVEAGNVYLPHPHVAPWVFDFIEELTAFPNAPNNDQVDAMTQALLRFTQKRTVRVV